METLFQILRKTNKHLVVYGKEANDKIKSVENIFSGYSTQIFSSKYSYYGVNSHLKLEDNHGKKPSDILSARLNMVGFFDSFFKALGFDNNYINTIGQEVKSNLSKPDCFEYAPLLLEEYEPKQCKKEKTFLTVKNSEYFFSGLEKEQIKHISYCVNEVIKDKYPLTICFGTIKDLDNNKNKGIIKLKGKIKRENLDIVPSYKLL